MPASSFRLEEVLPHRPPMALLDEIVAFDGISRELTAAATIRAEWSENWAAVELMAQAAAALAGSLDRLAGQKGAARPGFLLGTRRLTLDISRFEIGRRYLVTARGAFDDDAAASFDCDVRDGATVVARAVLNAYRPADVDEFFSGRPAAGNSSPRSAPTLV